MWKQWQPYILQFFQVFPENKKTNTKRISIIFNVFSCENNANHTYSNGFPCFFNQNQWTPYIFQWFSRFLMSWEILASKEQMWRPDPTKTSQDLKNIENHWNMYDFHCFLNKKNMENHWNMCVFFSSEWKRQLRYWNMNIYIYIYILNLAGSSSRGLG